MHCAFEITARWWALGYILHIKKRKEKRERKKEHKLSKAGWRWRGGEIEKTMSISKCTSL